MKTICWKELRENYRWALLAMIALGVAQWYALHQKDNEYSIGYDYSSKGLLLDSDPFLAVTTFGCAAAGLLLGFLQILPELRRDRWASLLHRPVSRGVLFRGKVAGGLLLYLLATVPPFLLSVWLVVTPGHFAAPFVPGMTLAGVADLCAGTAFYFAALAMTLPRGVWSGTRALPLLAALHLTYLVTSVEFFYVAVEAAVLMSLGLCAAGWAAMLQQDQFTPRPALGKIAGVVIAFYGICGLGDISLSIFKVVGPRQHSRAIDYNLSDTGVPLRLTYVDNVIVSVTDPAGKPLQDRKLQPDQVQSHLKYMNGCSSNIGDPHGWHFTPYWKNYRYSGEYLTFLRGYSYPRTEQWFYLVQQRVWVCYSPITKMPLDRLDRSGFAPLSSPPQPFGEESQPAEIDQSLFIQDQGKTTFFVLPQRRSLTLDLPPDGAVYGMGTGYARVGTGNKTVSIFGIALDDRLAVFDEKGAAAASLPYHEDVSQWGQLRFGMKGDKERFYIEYTPSAWLPQVLRDKMPSYVEELSAQGELLQKYTLPPTPPYWTSGSWSEYIVHRVQSPAFFFGSMVYQKMGALCGSQRLADQWARRFERDRDKTMIWSGWVLALSLASAAGAWFWARRAQFSTSRAWAWTLVVFAGGPGGLLVFRAVADWPQFVACPHCQRPRPVADERCPHCGAGWPVVPATDTEIFDDHPASPAAARA